MAKNKNSFKKGESGNPAGRPVGSVNKLQKDLQKMLREFLEANADDMQKWFDELEPKEKMQVYEKYLQYILPRKRENEIEAKVTEQERIIRKLFGDKKEEKETI